MRMLPPAVCLMGPTASGKTELAIELTRRFPLEIVSVDSAQVYRGMDIGTAKPRAEDLEVAPHRLIDICEPTEAYSAARFREDALGEMAAITTAGRVPLLTGGTMLYFRALQQGLSPLPQADPAVRAAIETQASVEGWAALHRRLQAVDPVSARRIHPNDPQRLQRALEVWMLTGRPLSELQRGGGARSFPYRLLKLARAPRDRQLLHRRIEQRFHGMLDAGFEAEVAHLMERPGMTADLPSMRAVGYRQMWKYLTGEFTREQMIERGIIATRQLAKRQFTWLRAEQDLVWLEEGPQCVEQATERLADFLIQ